MRKQLIPFSFIFLLFPILLQSQSASNVKKNPSFEEVLSLQSISNPVLSPDGKHILFEKSSTDWKNNRYDREIWISKDGAAPFQLSHNLAASSRNPKWSPDGQWIAFLSKRKEKTQIQVIRTAGGEAFQVTNTKGNISNYEWSPDGKQILFTQAADHSKAEKKRKEKFGSFAIEDEEYQLMQLWLIDFDPEQLNPMLRPDQMQDTTFQESRKPIQLMKEAKFSINSFKWSPDGSKIAFDHQPDPLINSFFKSDISVYNLATKNYKSLVSNPSVDALVAWSPDGQAILYGTTLTDSTSNYYLNSKLFRINIDGSNNTQLAKNFDEELSRVDWHPTGIFACVWQKTKRQLLRIDPQNGETSFINHPSARVYDFSFSKDGKQYAYIGAGDNNLTEVFTKEYSKSPPNQITQSSKQIEDWQVAQSEVISWKSKDGAMIEGVLHKPQDYDPKKKYPLMVVIHGGPTGISTPSPTPAYVYPMLQWLNKGALILRPNYRGSAGYGEAFRSLNVRNLGVGDAWDVLSGVQHLEDLGMIDSNKIASMGWSQGGYISAFISTNSKKFKAICVGAGISNWMTYYVNTDIHPFTRQYLKGTPWSDKAIYEKTSPMTNINEAVTPTLIQHGEFDKRVPIANAYELFQGLQDVGVETQLIVYKGFGHGITKPKERLAAVWHNWAWFGKYIWGEEIEIPEE